MPRLENALKRKYLNIMSQENISLKVGFDCNWLQLSENDYSDRLRERQNLSAHIPAI